MHEVTNSLVVLASWGMKLVFLKNEGWEIEEIKLWSKERWKSGNPKEWPPKIGL